MAKAGTNVPDPGVRAGYLGGDPGQPEPQLDGRLELSGGALRFDVPYAPVMEIALDDLEGITLSGRHIHRHGPFSRPIRGTMWVAAWREGKPAVWEFAVDRSAGESLRERINIERQAHDMHALPFVEELDEFPSPFVGAGNGDGAHTNGGNGAVSAGVEGFTATVTPDPTEPPTQVLDDPELQGSERQRESLRDFARRRPRLVIAMGAGAAIFITAEVLIPVLLS